MEFFNLMHLHIFIDNINEMQCKGKTWKDISGFNISMLYISFLIQDCCKFDDTRGNKVLNRLTYLCIIVSQSNVFFYIRYFQCYIIPQCSSKMDFVAPLESRV